MPSHGTPASTDSIFPGVRKTIEPAKTSSTVSCSLGANNPLTMGASPCAPEGSHVQCCKRRRRDGMGAALTDRGDERFTQGGSANPAAVHKVITWPSKMHGVIFAAAKITVDGFLHG